MPRKSAAAPVEKADDIYEVRKIHKYRIHNGVEQFFVEWDGYPIAEATWEPVTNFVNPSADIHARMEELRGKNRASLRRGQSNEKRRVTTHAVPAPPEASSIGKRKQRSNSVSTTAEPSSKRPSRVISGGRGSVVPQTSTGRATTTDASLSPRNKAQTGSSADSSSRPRTSEAGRSEADERSSTEETGKSDGDDNDEEQQPLQQEPLDVRVKSIRQDPTHGLIGIILIGGGAGVGVSSADTREARLPISDVKRLYPSQLIDFLLQRIQFRPDSSKVPTSNTSTAATTVGATSGVTPRSRS